MAVLFEHFAELQLHYPRLRLTQDTNALFLVRGVLEFSAVFQDTRIEDKYSIQIIIPNDYPNIPPTVIESDGRIPKEYHTFSDGTLCLGAPVAVRKTFLQTPTLVGFVENNLIPQLYRYSYKCEYGEYPYGELSHGPLGIFEFYQEYFDVNEPEMLLGLLKILAANNYRGHHNCPCLSGKRVRNCHGERLLEIWKWQSSANFANEYHEIAQMLVKVRQNRQVSIQRALHQIRTGKATI